MTIKQKILFILSVFLAITILIIFLIHSSNLDPDNPNIILLGWDGVQQNHFYELLNQGQLVNVDTLKENGAIVNLTITDHATDTKGGWSQVLTGYRWWKTGIYSNQLWFNSIPTNYTIIERLENHYGRENIKTAFITGFRFEMEIQDLTYSTKNGTYTNQAPYSNIPSKVDLVDVNFRMANKTTSIALQFIEDNQNTQFFTFIHFGEPDYAGHIPEGGENSELYSQAIKECDHWLGQIIQKLKDLNIYHKTFIYLTSDHGYDENGRSHLYAPDIVLVTNNNNVNRNGDQTDIAPTIYHSLGILNTIKPKLDGFPLQIALPTPEFQTRQHTIHDSTPPLTPIIVTPKQGEKINKNITISYTSFDENLSALLLLIDNNLKPATLTWENGNVSGTYNWNINEVEVGPHNIEVLASDNHGALNGLVSKKITVEIVK